MCRRIVPLAGVWLLLSSFGSARAQSVPTPPSANLEPGWHIVRPGDTLEALAARYLGSSGFWQRLAELNADLLDPDRIEPGRRIRVLLLRRTALPVAQIDAVSRKVEEQPHPTPWREASPGDLLMERDGVRTYSRSSAVMGFRDGTRLLITEDSLVFLSRTGTRLQGVPSHSVEIVEGQADVAVSSPGTAVAEGSRPEVEIVLGASRARSRPSPSGQAQARARRADGGGAKVMVYGGEGEVEAGGAKVQVPQGMGTSVESQGPPAPPEKLLPAPQLAAPVPDAMVACANPQLSWQPVPQSELYTVEVCRDPECGELVERAVGIAGTVWRAPALPVGTLYWRVTARSRSGLDGYPSAPSRISIQSARADLSLPTGSIRITGVTTSIGDRLYVAPGFGLEVQTADEGSGVAGWSPVIDGHDASLESWTRPWPGGEHTAGAVVQDFCGNRGAIDPVSFIVDADPPAIEWKAALPPPEQFQAQRRLTLRRDRAGQRRGLFWVPSDPEARLRWDDLWVSSPAGTVHQTVEVASDLPTVFLRLDGVRLTAGGAPLVTGEDQVLRIDAVDGASRVTKMVLQTRTTADGPVLEVQAVDGVGNSSRQEWKIER
jgi:hypothetical protein